MIEQMALLERFRLQELLSLRTETGCSGCLLGLLRLLRLLGGGRGMCHQRPVEEKVIHLGRAVTPEEARRRGQVRWAVEAFEV